MAINGQSPGPTPFIGLLDLTVDDASTLASIEFKIYPKPASDTRPVYARYSAAYLQTRGWLNTTTGAISLPVFGLYADYNNRVALVSTFTNQSTQRDTVNVLTPIWNGGANNKFKTPTVVQPRLPNASLSYDFSLLRSNATAAPLIIDTDGEVRWIGTLGVGSNGILFFEGGLYMYFGPLLYRLEFDGAFSLVADYSASQGVTAFHHSMDKGKTGLLMEADTATQTESVLMEVDGAGTVLKRWDFANIISAAMIAGGDDPSGFVKTRGAAGEDWFHNNAATYRPSDNTLVVSGRELFVIAIDYDTGAIKWLLGDPTKKWGQYPSLLNYSLSLGPNTLAPIGEHALSISRDRLLLFDNGTESRNQTPAGNYRTYNAPRKYSIDTVAMTATETWNYAPTPSLYAPFCSSVYEDGSRSYLVAYAKMAALMGLDSSGNKVFDYRYSNPAQGCGTIFNAIPIHLENLRFE